MDFDATTYAHGFAAGMLSIASPGVLLLAPLAAATAASPNRLGAVAPAFGLIASFTASGLFVATTGFALGLDATWFRTVGATLLAAYGVLMSRTALHTPLAAKAGGVHGLSDSVRAALELESFRGRVIVGLLLGLVWTPCAGPTLSAATTLASRGEDLPQAAALMMMFALGAALPVTVVGEALATLRSQPTGSGGRHWVGAMLLAVGVCVLIRADRHVAAIVVKHSPAWFIDFATRY